MCDDEISNGSGAEDVRQTIGCHGDIAGSDSAPFGWLQRPLWLVTVPPLAGYSAPFGWLQRPLWLVTAPPLAGYSAPLGWLQRPLGLVTAPPWAGCVMMR